MIWKGVVLLALMALSAYCSAQTVCPPNFAPLSGYHGCYAIVTSKKTWADAQSNCKTLHAKAHLAAIISKEEDTAIVNHLKSIPGVTTEERRYYTAGQSPTLSPPYAWKLNDQQSIPFCYQGFFPTEPNGIGKEGCIEYYTADNGDIKWNDIDCSTLKKSICEYDLGI